MARWNPSPSRFIKINFDGSLTNSSAAGSFIFHDWTCKLIKAGVAYYNHISSLVAKAKVLHDGVNIAIQTGFKKLIIESDNKIVI